MHVSDFTNVLQVANEKLAKFKIPKKIFFVNEIPKGATGKLQRNILRAGQRTKSEINSSLLLDDYNSVLIDRSGHNLNMLNLMLKSSKRRT